MKSSFYWIPYFFAIVISTYSECPPRELTPDCYCTHGDNIYSSGYLQVQCFNLTDPVYFKNQWQNFAGQLKKHSSLSLSYVDLHHFSEDTFNDTMLRSLTIIRSKIRRLSDTNLSGSYVFKGLEQSLTSFAVRGCTDVEFWDWNQFSILKRLMYLTLQGCEIKVMNSMYPISRLPLVSFQLDGGDVKFSSAKIMLSSRELSTFGFMNSHIERIERHWFPKPANSLHYLSLRNTSLYFIPADMFEAMPVLRYLDLSKNQIQTISEQTFLPVIHNLDVLMIHGNPLHCDAHILWLTRFLEVSTSHPSDRRTRRMLATIRSLSCQTPSTLKGKILSSVFESDLELDNELT